ncbi:DUF2092 domain-containing protein [Pseudomonadota bacterium]
MLINKQDQLLFQLVGLIFLFSALLVSRSGFCATADADTYQQAKSRLKESTTFLSRQKQFSVVSRSTIEAVLYSGKKLQFDQAASLSVQRPDKLRAERHGDLVDQIFYYDGQSLTLYNPQDKYYATVSAPDNLEAMLNFARESLDIVAPAGDLFYTNAFEILMQDVTVGYVIGKSVIEGVRCDHLAFRSPHVDWQLWVQEGSKPLPRKLVITSSDVVNAPQFTVLMTGWDLKHVPGQLLFYLRLRNQRVLMW